MTGHTLADLLAEPWYPEAPAEERRSDTCRGDLPRPFEPGDAQRGWLLDFHCPNGVVPLAVSLTEDLALASQRAGRRWRSGTGLTARFAGPHPYIGAAAALPGAESETGDTEESGDIEDAVLAYQRGFRTSWQRAARTIEEQLIALESADVEELDLDGLRGYLAAARQVHRVAWLVHFDTMYPLFRGSAAYVRDCAEVGIGPTEAVALLQGERTRITDTDLGLQELAHHARAEGVAEAFLDAAGPDVVLDRLRGDTRAEPWLRRFAAFLRVHGHRGGGLADLTTPSWIEDPSTPLGMVTQLLRSDGTLGSPMGGPKTQGLPTDRVRSRAAAMPAASRERFLRAWEIAKNANSVWWNEEHNALIDLRAHLPVRRAALALGRLLGAEPPDGALYLFASEVDRLLSRAASWRDLDDVVSRRRAYTDGWRRRRNLLPRSVGTAIDAADPVLTEIFGTHVLAEGMSHAESSAHAAVLRGLGVSAGRRRGRARVVRTLDELVTVAPGSVLVCPATTPAWTPVFAILAACVCDEGGMLTHSAIVSREYGLPCVCAVGSATAEINDGDLLEVDGDAGTVAVIERGCGDR